MVTYEYYESLPLNYSISKVTIFSLCWRFILLHHVRNGFLFVSSHGFPISAGFQLTLFTRAKQARPFFPSFLQTCSRKLWIQATARFPVGHTYNDKIQFYSCEKFKNVLCLWQRCSVFGCWKYRYCTVQANPCVFLTVLRTWATKPNKIGELVWPKTMGIIRMGQKETVGGKAKCRHQRILSKSASSLEKLITG